LCNPLCPEPDCKSLLRVRKLKINLGFSGCPFCKSDNSKPYIMTEKKKGMRKCMKCRKDYMPERRQGFTKYFVCKYHTWQRFKVGAEVIMRKAKPKTENDLIKDAGAKRPFQAKNQQRQPNVQIRPRA